MIKEKAERWARREYEWVEEDNEMVERQLRSRRRRSCHVLQRDSVTSPQRGGNSSTTSSSDQISVATAQPIRRRRTSSDGDATSVLDFVAHDERTMIRTSESLMAKSREREHRLRSRLSYLKMTTNNVEDFVQLALLLVLISFWHTNTSSISTGVGASDVLFQVWGGDDSLIPHPEYVFASTSLLSLILGHMSLLSTNKNGFTTFIGHWFIALPYFIISTASRIFSVVLFFTPIIGLFDTLHLVQMGMIPASSDKWTGPNVGYTENPDGTFNGTWSKFSFADNSEFPGIPFWVGFTPAILMGIHILVGFVILYVVLGDYEGEWDDLPLLRSDVVAEENTEQDMEGNVPKEEQKEQTPRKYKYGRRALYSLWTMVCPPLFLDWEEILRHYTDSVIFDKKPWERELPKDLVEECWRKQNKIAFAFILLNFIENLVLCTPLFYLKYRIDLRNNRMSHFFPLLPEEEISTQRVDQLLIAAIVINALLPGIQAFMAYAYFRWGHPWKRITNHLCFPADKDDSVNNGLRESSRSQASNRVDVPAKKDNATELDNLARPEEANSVENEAESCV